jgi:hypothetical protein
MTNPRIILIACVIWLLALFTALPRAAQTAETGEGGVKENAKQIHKNLSLFTTSDNCIACHNVLVTPDGEDVSIGASWRSTMMANSARDPYWQAGVRRENDRSSDAFRGHSGRMRRVSHADVDADLSRVGRQRRGVRTPAVQQAQWHRDPEVRRRQHLVHRLPSDLQRAARHS